MKQRIGAIDAWGSLISPKGASKWSNEMKSIFKRYKSDPRIMTGMTEDEMLAEMDEAGVDMVVLSAFDTGGMDVVPVEEVAKVVARHPRRFVGCGTVDPRLKPMKLRDEVKRQMEELGLIAIRLEPYAYGNGMVGLPPCDKLYWPVYITCSELDVPVSIQVGHTGPLLPSEAGRPIYLDEVALAFPELTIIGAHLGQPWHEEMMILAWKHPNVYIETSARTPAYWPDSFKEYCLKHGQDKALWATDYPLLSYKRCIDEVFNLGFGNTINTKLLRDNTIRAFKLDKRCGLTLSTC